MFHERIMFSAYQPRAMGQATTLSNSSALRWSALLCQSTQSARNRMNRSCRQVKARSLPFSVGAQPLLRTPSMVPSALKSPRLRPYPRTDAPSLLTHRTSGTASLSSPATEAGPRSRLIWTLIHFPISRKTRPNHPTRNLHRRTLASTSTSTSASMRTTKNGS